MSTSKRKNHVYILLITFFEFTEYWMKDSENTKKYYIDNAPLAEKAAWEFSTKLQHCVKNI